MDGRAPGGVDVPAVSVGEVRLGEVRLGEVRLGEVRLGEVPLLEYDADPEDPISAASPPSQVLPTRAVLTFLGDVTPAWAHEHGFIETAWPKTVNQTFPVWVGEHRGVPVALADLPIGAAAAVTWLEYVLRRGVRDVVAAGSCGGLRHFAEGEFVLPVRALRDEGTSYHYLPAARWVRTDDELREACAAAVREAGLTPVEVDTWTTDAFYRETRTKIAARLEEGCAVVEMECSALAACARFRGARFAQILYTADTLADPKAWDARGFGRGARGAALRLALDAVTRG